MAAFDAGVKLGTGYPGTPSTEILETFEKLGGRAEEFAAALGAALRELSPDGTFTEVAELVALLARRPQTDA